MKQILDSLVGKAMDAKEVAFKSVNGIGNKIADQYFNTSKYMEDADRTTGPDFHAELVPPSVLLDAIAGVRAVSPTIDAIKKALFYGKPNEDLAFSQRIAEKGEYTVDKDLIHSILGIYTEAAELMELLEDALRGKPVDEAKLVNEAGDVMWYQALLFKLLKTNFEEVGDKNIAKLRERYPVKFSADLAVNRDEAKENTVFK